MRSVCVTAITAVLLSSAPASAEAQPKLVVMKLAAERGIDESLVRLLNELLLAEFSGMGQYEVLGESDVSALLTHESKRQILNCEDASCMAEIGGAMGADFLLASNIGKIGDSYLLNLKLIDVDAARVVHRFSKPIKGIEEALINAVRTGAARVSGREVTGGQPILEPTVTASESGGSSWRWVALGTTVALAATGGALLLVAGSEDTIRQNEYDEFLNGTGNYSDVEDAVSSHNTMVTAGWVLVGLGAASAAWTGYLFASGPSHVAIAPTDGGALVTIGGGF